jgi:hypothetical protein
MPTDTLRAVRIRIDAGWSQDVHARDRIGEEVSLASDEASAWTLSAAFALAGKDGIPMDHLHGALRALADVTGMNSIEGWNDDPRRTKQDVLDALDAAIERIEGTDSE